ncbi:MAG: hypothetical protein M3336_02040 [Chloroflexota bacterium]|nr:hypothetical protein [Chloroflexota bacterium]
MTYFRVFEPVHLSEHSVRVRVFADLDAHLELVLAAGHVERDGTVIWSKREGTLSASPLVRSGADRAAHADDEQFVFPRAGSGPAPAS